MQIITNTEQIQFVLRNGDKINACLDQNPGGGTRLCLWSDNGTLAVLPIDGRAVRVTTHRELIPDAVKTISMEVRLAAEKIMASLKPGEIAYAASKERGEYRGFAALHDLFDANMLLPGAGRITPDRLKFWNNIMDEVTRLLLNHELAHLPAEAVEATLPPHTVTIHEK